MSDDRKDPRATLFERVGFGLLSVMAIGILLTIVIAYCVSPLPR